MQAAVVDSNVLYGARMQRDQWHDRGRAIVAAMDTGELPVGRVTNYALPEVLNPLQKRAGYDAARDTLTFLAGSAGFELVHLSKEDFTRGRAIFRRRSELELPDAMTVAYMERAGLEYVYSFDDDFDAVDGITRLETGDDPFAAEG